MTPQKRTKVSSVDTRLLQQMIDEAFDRRSWHGPNLRGSIRGLSAAEAAWRPHPKRHCIAEHVAHAAYWKYVVRRRLRGDKRGSFSLTGSNWFTLTDPWTEDVWREYLRLLDSEHRAMRTAIGELTPRQILRAPAGSKVSNRQLICGIAYHDVYHAGQIQLLKRMLNESEVD
jgi:DinB superfamily